MSQSLVEAFEEILQATRQAFPQMRSFAHARRLAYGFAVVWGRRTISRALCAVHGQFEDWSASYRFFSRSPWRPNDVFQPVLQRCLAQGDGPFAVAMDDTTTKKTGKHVPGVRYLHDPMSPAFAPGFMRGHRFIQASAILRPEELNGPARAIPVRFHPAPSAKKPGKRADEVAWATYHEAQRRQSLSVQGALVIADLRKSMDDAGYPHRNLLVAVDGGYCNRNVLRHLPDRVELIAHARGDVRLFRPLTAVERMIWGRRRKYGEALPLPKDMLADEQIPWKQEKVFGAGKLHDLDYKVMDRVLWRSGTRDRQLRLFVIRPLRYRPRIGARLLYRDPAYLLTTDLVSPDKALLQAYFDRWEIEVNHRDEKDLLGVDQAQVWSEEATWRVPQFQVAVYAMLLLAALKAHGPTRTDAYLPVPKWRKKEIRRPSTLDILALLREELMEQAINGFRSPVRANEARRPDTDGSSTYASPTPAPIDPITAALYASG